VAGVAVPSPAVVPVDVVVPFAVFVSDFVAAFADLVADFVVDLTGLALVDFAGLTLGFWTVVGFAGLFAETGFAGFADALGFAAVGLGFGLPCAENTGVAASRNATATAKIERLIGSSVTQIAKEGVARVVPRRRRGLNG
jgi:hypothetical protein